MSDRIEYEYPYWPDEITQLTDRAEAAEARAGAAEARAKAAEAERDALRDQRDAALAWNRIARAERDRYRELLREACSFAYWGNRRATDDEAFALHSRLVRVLSEEQG